MKRMKFLLAVSTCTVVMAGCGKNVIVEDVAPPTAAVSESGAETYGQNEGQKSEAGSSQEQGSTSAKAGILPERTEAVSGEVGPEKEEPLVNPLLGLPVTYAGEYGEGDNETIKLINCFLDTYKKQVNKNKIVSVTTADFDENGTVEAFIFYGEGDDICYTGEYCFVDGKKTEGMGEVSVYSSDGYIECPGKKFAYFEEYYATCAVSHVFELDHGKPVEANISRIGDVGVKDDGTITITYSCYNGMFDKDIGDYIGHTWLPYYFYYDQSKGRFVESAGISLPLDKIEATCGIDLYEKLQQKGLYVADAMIRSNGILTINALSNDSFAVNFYNISYDCKNKRYLNSWYSDKDDIDFDSAIQEGIYSYAISCDADQNVEVNQYREEVKFEVKADSDIIRLNEFETIVLGEVKGNKRVVKITDNTSGSITKAGAYQIVVTNATVEKVK